MIITEKYEYHLPYTVLNLHHANKAVTEVPELIV